MSEKRKYKCAIYTRKSHEEGLDQDFNSLDAQREACEAYILSQAGLGWELSTKLYDDGGISGGHLERAGLQALLEDIRAGQVDIVVVYKVDRLTRSITDFGKLVETFDAQDVSFVSVTQAFNTTNSMGRLTLNVLLSFAQFEREVTAERIRDKIAGSKQKGMWMGGRVPYGYRNENKKLFIQEVDAANVKLMFELYLNHKNLPEVKQELDRRNIVSRQRTAKSGIQTGGLPFTAGNIRSILSNPIYIGDIRHKQNIYRGNHAAIIERSVWDKAQSTLADKNNKQHSTTNTRSPALLKGLLYDAEGNRLISHHVNKKGSKYYYYVTRDTQNKVTTQSDSKTANQQKHMRLPMQMIEEVVKKYLIEGLKSKQTLFEVINVKQTEANKLYQLSKRAENLATNLESAKHIELEVLYQKLIKRIVISSNKIEIEFKPDYFEATLELELTEKQSFKIIKPICIRRRGQEIRLIVGGKPAEARQMDMSLVKLIAKAHLLKREIETGAVNSIKEFAEKYSLDHGDAKNLVPLCYLSPSIIEDIYDGIQPTKLTTSRLKATANNLPLRWREQRQVLGFAN